jgi:hypothetical protein
VPAIEEELQQSSQLTMNPIRMTILSLAVIFCSSCSTLIYSAGKSPEDTFNTNATRASASAEFGPPVGGAIYQKPRLLTNIPEFKNARWHYLVGENADPLASGHEDYRYRGQIGGGDQQAIGMAWGMTLGLAEFVLFPMSVRHAIKHSGDEHLFRVWYSLRGNCVGYTHQ